mmetsp:Transcript_27373/g.59815  ORF Transcript_27373/g.59815 Transcript_27373/m.59815 type:complete len:202 (-) Transcript_27373:496-1101(-)
MSSTHSWCSASMVGIRTELTCSMCKPCSSSSPRSSLCSSCAGSAPAHGSQALLVLFGPATGAGDDDVAVAARFAGGSGRQEPTSSQPPRAASPSSSASSREMATASGASSLSSATPISTMLLGLTFSRLPVLRTWTVTRPVGPSGRARHVAFWPVRGAPLEEVRPVTVTISPGHTFGGGCPATSASTSARTCANARSRTCR